jgi:exoribonuclease II
LPPSEIRPGALVLYKGRPALVKTAADKLELELESAPPVKVRPKDAALLHPGPLRSLSELNRTVPGDPATAWELLEGQTVSLEELAELAYSEYTPWSAWAAWQQVAQGLHFRGTPEAVSAASGEEVARLIASRQAQADEESAWQAFLERASLGTCDPQDRRYLGEVEELALKRRDSSRVLRDLKRGETPENAHAFLLEVGYWTESTNPYPARLGVNLSPPQVELPALPSEARLDLTHLPAYAIDDEGSQDPDDAVSLEGERVWVHVADAAALVAPDSEIDLEARQRGANLYLPEGTIPMLPDEVTPLLALGLQAESPALSFGLTVSAEGEIEEIEIVPSRVRVERLSYAEAQERIAEEPFASLNEIARRFHARRLRQGAVSIDLPEVKMRVVDGDVLINPIPSLESRDMVRECMLMAGEAAARYVLREGIPAPFAVQAPPERELPADLPSLPPDSQASSTASMHALRRIQNRSQVSSLPGAHSGLGLPAYVRATSPLRRYMDLVAHQQIRRHLRGEAPLDEQEMIERVGASEAVTGGIVQAESLSRRHWTLVYLLGSPGWRGEAVLIEKRGRRGRVIIPELAYEAWVSLRGSPDLDAVLELEFSGASLPELEGYFRVVKENAR